MKDDTTLYADRKYRLTAAETLAMLERAGIPVPELDQPAFSIRIDGTIDHGRNGTGPDSYVTTVSVRSVSPPGSAMHGGVMFHWNEETPGSAASVIGAAALAAAEMAKQAWLTDAARGTAEDVARANAQPKAQ